ncbi:MAG: protein kinase family protein, partial [Novipirellula sp. JB048]
DIFSLGRMLWQWLTRVETASDLLLSPVAELVERMISPEPADRPTASEVTDQLLRLEIESLGCHIEPENRRRRAA